MLLVALPPVPLLALPVGEFASVREMFVALTTIVGPVPPPVMVSYPAQRFPPAPVRKSETEEVSRQVSDCDSKQLRRLPTALATLPQQAAVAQTGLVIGHTEVADCKDSNDGNRQPKIVVPDILK